MSNLIEATGIERCFITHYELYYESGGVYISENCKLTKELADKLSLSINDRYCISISTEDMDVMVYTLENDELGAVGFTVSLGDIKNG